MFIPDEQTIKTLIREVKGSSGERLHLPSQVFWEKVGLTDTTQEEKELFAELLRRRKLAFTFETRRDAVYLVWVGNLGLKVKTPKSQRNEALMQEKIKRGGNNFSCLKWTSVPPIG